MISPFIIKIKIKSKAMQDKNTEIEAICSEFKSGYEVHSDNEPHVTIFGSARLKEQSPDYQLAREVAKLLSQKGVPVMTGGGPGIMEAGNCGAKQGKGVSLASSILLPHEQLENEYIDKTSRHQYFMPRKWFLLNNARGFVGAPGGFGTADEIFEVLCLIQTEKAKRVPLVLLGTSFWEPAIQWMKASMLPMGLIAESDLDLFIITDDAEEAVRYLMGDS
ncbi:TIGR00730 family Rossman fold protein [Vibrio harveyi]|uniref:LOG family protein n=1 Tax=Vibrio harveyi TaxID=669 RepID=UPI003CF581B1